MKIVQAAIVKVTFLLLLIAGIALIFKPPGQLYALIRELSFFPAGEHTRIIVRVIGGVVISCAAFLVLFPFVWRRRKGNQIVFDQGEGKTTVQLSPIETALTKAVCKLPQIKKASVKVLPDEEGRKVRVYAEVVLMKTASSGVREASARATAAVKQEAVRVLGVDEVTLVELDLRDIVITDAGDVVAIERLPAVMPPPPREPKPAARVEEDEDELEAAEAEEEPVQEDDEDETVLPGSPLDADEDRHDGNPPEAQAGSDKWGMT